jgi:hypothetical protein
MFNRPSLGNPISSVRSVRLQPGIREEMLAGRRQPNGCAPEAAERQPLQERQRWNIRLMVLVLAARLRRSASRSAGNMITLCLGVSCAILSTFVKQRT